MRLGETALEMTDDVLTFQMFKGRKKKTCTINIYTYMFLVQSIGFKILNLKP